MPNEEGYLSGLNRTERRDVLKGLGAGALAFPFMTGTTSAEQDMSLRVSVEAGEGDADNWTPRDRLTDEFKARVDISGVTGNSKIALMTFPVGGTNYVADNQLRATTFMPDWTSGYVVHGEPWYPTGTIGGIGSWEPGMYQLYTVVAEDREESFGAAVSEPFEVAP